MKKSKPFLVVYEGRGEVLVMRPEQEAECIMEYFTKGGRVIDNYDRSEKTDVVEVSAPMKCW